MKIADCEIGPDYPIFLQAEVGVTHNGDVKQALALVDAATEVGLDACKFIVTDPVKIGAYQSLFRYETAEGSKTAPIGDLLAKTTLTFDEWQQVRDRCHERGIIFYATADHLEAVEMLEELGVPAHKVSSWDIAYVPLIERMIKTGKPVIVEVGTATKEEWCRWPRWKQILPMHAPHPYENRDWNLNRWHGPLWGFSSPARISWCDFIALAKGASILEKRFTLDRQELAGHHHWISLEPAEMAVWVAQVRNAEEALAEDPWAGSEVAWAERRRWDRDERGFRHG